METADVFCFMNRSSFQQNAEVTNNTGRLNGCGIDGQLAIDAGKFVQVRTRPEPDCFSLVVQLQAARFTPCVPLRYYNHGRYLIS